MTHLSLKDLKIGSNQLVVVSGPCVIESRDHVMRAAETLSKMFEEIQVPLIFKSSYDKANRSSLSSYRGPGMEEGLKILQEVKTTFGLPIFSDIHSPEQAAPAADHLADGADVHQRCRHGGSGRQVCHHREDRARGHRSHRARAAQRTSGHLLRKGPNPCANQLSCQQQDQTTLGAL